MNNINIKELNISTEMEEFTKENGYSFERYNKRSK
jgi:hypothetical protein